jgi:apolipoprotein N-acyltransferase
MAWTGHLGRLRSRGARRGFGDALYAIAALWLSAFITYLVYLLLPFEYLALGLFGLSPIVIIGSALLAGIVALALLVWLVRRLLRPAWRGEAIGGWRFGIVVALAVATVALDAGRTHYLVPLPPTDQDDCSFGPISRQEYGTIAHEIKRKFDPDWLAVFAQRGFKREFERQLMTALPETASEVEMIARIHALARAIGAELDTEGYYKLALHEPQVARPVTMSR